MSCLAEPMAWAANLMFIVGAYYIARRHRGGLLCQAGANVVYVWYALIKDAPALAALSLTLGAISVWGFVRWGTTETNAVQPSAPDPQRAASSASPSDTPPDRP